MGRPRSSLPHGLVTYVTVQPNVTARSVPSATLRAGFGTKLVLSLVLSQVEGVAEGTVPRNDP